MPCRSDYLRPSGYEQKMQQTAQLLRYALLTLGQPVPDWVAAEAKNLYAHDERVVTMLCDLLTKLDTATREALVYNAHDRNARILATWWEDHRKADAARVARESKQEADQRTRQQALQKLTPEERDVLGV